MNTRILFVTFKRSFHRSPHHRNTLRLPNLDFNYICNPDNIPEISRNISKRKSIGDIKLVNELKVQLENTPTSDAKYQECSQRFYEECLKIPNSSHPDVQSYGEDPKVINLIGALRQFEFEPREFHEISKRLNLVRTEQLGYLTGSRSYFVQGELAEMENALIRYTIDSLMKRNFEMMTVPDILHRDVIESCGMNTRGERNQVYSLHDQLHDGDRCLSGTSEMALAGFFKDKIISEEQLPLKLATVSRCFRAETSSIAEERGIYRVHEFTKVEMFAVTRPEMSDETLEGFKTIEEENFAELGLHLRTLDMPPYELGAPAYRKYDVEAWLPGRKIFGEISSCSNCTDFQSRRLNIKYKTTQDDLKYVHTLNGTACAIPRMLIALVETYQNDNGTISVPEVLRKYFRNKSLISRQKSVPELRLIKHKK